MKRFVFLALLSWTMLAGCNGSPVEKQAEAGKEKPPVAVGVPQRVDLFTGNTAEDQVKNTIMRYNQLLVYGYDKLNMNPLQEVATVRQAEKAYHHMAAIGEGGVRMTSAVKKTDFTKITFPIPEKAEVKTRELWDFAYNDIKTGVKKEEMKDFVYLMNYWLERQNGRWIIVDIRAAEETPAPADAKSKSGKGAGTAGSTGAARGR